LSHFFPWEEVIVAIGLAVVVEEFFTTTSLEGEFADANGGRSFSP
jgi:hypothetical protein